MLPHSSEARSRAPVKPTSPQLDPVRMGVEGPMTPLYLEEETTEQATNLTTKRAGHNVEKGDG